MKHFRPKPESLQEELDELLRAGVISQTQYAQASAVVGAPESALRRVLGQLKQATNSRLTTGQINAGQWIVCQHKLDSLLEPCKLCGAKACPWDSNQEK